jgi:hypothetical protein
MGRKAKAKMKRGPGGQGGPKPGPHPARRRRPGWIGGILLVLLIVGGSVGAWQWYQAWVTPEPAPHFNLPASTGKWIALTDYVGKQEVVLLFYMGAG